jgi:hypothetical protein
MATKVKTDSSKRNEKLELAAGTLKLAREARARIPEIIGLQRALGAGGVATQRREIERLAKKYDDSHPRVIEAKARIAQLQAHQAQFDRGLDGLEKAVETLTVENTFHGYVVDAEGAPVVKYMVRIGREKQAQGELGAATDDSGYFRIDLGEGKPRSTAGPFAINSVLMARMGRFTSGFQAGIAEAGTAEAGASAKEASGAHSRKRAATAASTTARDNANNPATEWVVRIFDQSGKLVHTDEIPVLLEPGRSVFRYYALP